MATNGGRSAPSARRDPESVYQVVQLVGSSPDSWEQAAQSATSEAAKTISDLRVARVVELDTHIVGGEVQQKSFPDLPLLKLAECPAIEVYFVPSDAPPTGVGGPAADVVSRRVSGGVLIFRRAESVNQHSQTRNKEHPPVRRVLLVFRAVHDSTARQRQALTVAAEVKRTTIDPPDGTHPW